jgi:hypothetical protein
VETYLDPDERLKVCLPDTGSRAFRRAHKRSVGLFATVPIVITNRRVLFFGVQRGELALVDEHPCKDVEVVEYRSPGGGAARTTLTGLC